MTLLNVSLTRPNGFMCDAMQNLWTRCCYSTFTTYSLTLYPVHAAQVFESDNFLTILKMQIMFLHITL